MCLGHVSACSHLLGWFTITCFDDTWNAERFSMVEWLNEMEDSMIDGKKHKPGVMDNCIKPILNLKNDLSVLMSVNVSILKYFYRISYDSWKKFPFLKNCMVFRSYIIVCETVYFQANMPFSVKIEGINYKYRAIRKYDTSEIDHDFTKYGIHILWWKTFILIRHCSPYIWHVHESEVLSRNLIYGWFIATNFVGIKFIF